MSGFLCGWLPAFRLQAAAAHLPQLPAVVEERNGLLDVVADLNPAAREANIELGMPIAQALGRHPALLRWARAPEAERGLTRLLQQTAESLSPRVQLMGADVALLDFRGLERLHGCWQRAAQHLEQPFAAQAKQLRSGFAAQPALALVAARSGLRELPAGEEAAWLAPLPLGVLAELHELTGTLIAAEEVAEMLLLLQRWGVRTLGALAALPQAALAARLGKTGAHLQAIARGEVAGLLDTPPVPVSTLASGSQFDPPLANLEVLAAALSDTLTQLAAELDCHDRVAEGACLQLTHGNKGITSTYHRAFAIPTRDPKTLAAQMVLALERTPPRIEIHEFAIELRLTRPRRIQSRLFSAASPDRAKLPKLLGLLGEAYAGRMGSPRLEDNHRPQAFTLMPYAPRGEGEAASPPSQPPAVALTLRIYRPPQPLDPATIVQRAGPWRSCGNWWREAAGAGPWNCDEWDAELRMPHEAISSLYRLLHDQTRNRWYILGRYD